MIRVARVRRGASTRRATPKSVSLARGAPPGPGAAARSSRTFSGLTSRWTIPAACAAARPSATSAMIEAAVCGGSAPSRSSRERRSVPWTSSITRARSLPSTTMSRTPTTRGWSRLVSAVRSWTKRPTSTWSAARSSRSSLTATGPSGPSPSQTVPAEPRPITWWTADLACQCCSVGGAGALRGSGALGGAGQQRPTYAPGGPRGPPEGPGAGLSGENSRGLSTKRQSCCRARSGARISPPSPADSSAAPGSRRSRPGRRRRPVRCRPPGRAGSPGHPGSTARRPCPPARRGTASRCRG